MVIFKFRNLNTGQATPIPPGEYTVGRDDAAYVHIDDASVSRLHARLFNSEGGFFVEDIGSSNGTAMGGSLITGRVRANYGDTIHVGSVPFRIDPEVAGEVSAAPSAGLRVAKRSSLSRATERISFRTEPSRDLPLSASAQLSAPDVAANVADADKLNAVVMREPEPATPTTVPVVRPGLTPLSPEKPETILPVPTPARAQTERPASAPSFSRQAPAAVKQEKPASTVPSDQVASVEKTPETAWGMWTLIFLAGMGTGLLLGLFFARMFIELGGKGAHLP